MASLRNQGKGLAQAAPDKTDDDLGQQSGQTAKQQRSQSQKPPLIDAKQSSEIITPTTTTTSSPTKDLGTLGTQTTDQPRRHSDIITSASKIIPGEKAD